MSNLKKVILLGCGFFLSQCTSIPRAPSSIADTGLTFELYGTNSIPQKNREMELLDFNSLEQKKIVFKKIKLNDPQAEAEISNWQSQIQKSSADEGYHFEYKKVVVSVDDDTLDLVRKILTALDRTEANSTLRLLKKAEVIEAFNERFRSDMDLSFDILLAPFQLLKRVSPHTIAHPDAQVPDLDIRPSSFWAPREASSVDMWNGPGKFDFSKLTGDVCTYRGAKKGFGVHAGFKVKCSGTKLKAKFGNETYSGPLNSRIYHRLGLNVPAIHYVPALKIKYDRNIFAEINSRKQKYIKISLAGAPVYDYRHFQTYDTLQFIKAAHLLDGTEITVDELKKRLFIACQKSCDPDEKNIQRDFEKQIDFLTFIPSTVTEELDGEEIGPWNYSRLDHPDRTELKSLLILGAWTGNFDLRKDNTRLIFSKKTGEIKHFISDPGSGLGSAGGLIKNGGSISDMSWSVSMETLPTGQDSPQPVIRISNYKELEANRAFQNISFEDARWMVSQIASIHEDEISEALAASGLSAAEFLLAREKLISRQQKMIEDFSLKDKFGSGFRVVNKHLNFDPGKDRLEIKRHDGTMYLLENRNIGLKDGVLQKN